MSVDSIFIFTFSDFSEKKFYSQIIKKQLKNGHFDTNFIRNYSLYEVR